MATPIQITQDTIVKILIRRGTDSERQLTVLTEGELGYTIDTQRLFVGDGLTLGGIPAGNKFLGIASDKSIYNSIAQAGDTIYQSGGTGSDAQVLYASTGNNSWEDIHPKPFAGYIANTIPSLEKATDGKWRVASLFVGGESDDAVPSGFTLAYEDTGYTPQSVTQKYNRLDFDARYISLCADTVDPFLNSSFYFGNLFNRKVSNNLNATVNVDNSFFINGRQSSNTYQIQMYATDPTDNTSSLIRSVEDTFKIRAADRLSLQNDGGEGYQLNYSGSTLTTIFSSRQDGTYGNPNFIFRGTPLFKDDVFFDYDSDVTILGNLSVYGDTTYLETTVTTTSALSVINRNGNYDAMVVAQYNYPANPNQTVARFQEGEYNYSILAIRESQFVGVNVDAQTNAGTTGFNFVVSGGSHFTPHPLLAGNFLIDHNDVRIVGDGTVSLAAKGAGNLYLSAGAAGFVEVAGGLRASDDIVAFSTSDVKLKQNISYINSPLEKIDKISGVNFDWAPNAPFTGHDIGVLAHEIESIIPEAVITRGNGTKAVRYEKIIPLLIESIKELKAKLESKNVVRS